MAILFNRYRDLHIADPSAHPFYRSLGRDDLIFAARTRRFSTTQVQACLSLRTVTTGRVLYEVERTPLRLEPGSFLLLNDGQPYAVRIDSNEPVESFCLYFAPRTVVDAFRGLRDPSLRRALEVLDEVSPPRLLDRLYPIQGLNGPLERLRRAVHSRSRPDGLELDGLVSHVLTELLYQQLGVTREIERLSSTRPATRREHYRRIHRARDYIHSLLPRPFTNAELARVAGLSTFHFQRVFAEVLGVSVHRYVSSLRVATAKDLLRESDEPIEAIAWSVGFEHASSLTRAMLRAEGLGPREYRRRFRTGP